VLVIEELEELSSTFSSFLVFELDVFVLVLTELDSVEVELSTSEILDI
jgi:hypothetical protein